MPEGMNVKKECTGWRKDEQDVPGVFVPHSVAQMDQSFDSSKHTETHEAVQSKSYHTYRQASAERNSAVAPGVF